MPVFWVALFGTRRQLVVALAAVAAVFTLPIVLVGGARYPMSEWRAALLWTLVLTIVGHRVNALVQEIKRRAYLAREHAAVVEQHVQELADTHASLQAMAQLAREVSSTPDARDLICAAAVSGSGAALATLVEPDGQGGFYVTGTAGIEHDLERVRAEVRPNASIRAFYSRERLFIPDTADQPGLSPLLIEGGGVKSVVFEPILRHDKPVGILCIGWSEPRAELDERTTTVISYLAAEAGAAIERADFVAQLDQLARTDQLTELPNRRSWVQVLDSAIDAGRDQAAAALLHRDPRPRSLQALQRPLRPSGRRRAAAKAATVWREQLRGNDLLARYGGEEFAVMLPGCTLPEASQVLERLRSSTPCVTCSAGLRGVRAGRDRRGADPPRRSGALSREARRAEPADRRLTVRPRPDSGSEGTLGLV